MLELKDLSCGYEGTAVVEHIDLKVEPGQVLVILGPNGVGKTTLFKTLLGLIPRIGGDIILDGAPLDMRPDHEVMRRFAYVPQAHIPSFAFTVLEIVLMGRTARMKAFATPSDADREIAMKAMDELGLADLADRPYTQISGGERQLVLIARALTQEPDILVMDEPAASLDLGNQAKLLRLAYDLSHERGLSVLMTSHNPDHALLIADRVFLIEHGACLYGSADEVLNRQNLSEAYGTDIEITCGDHPDSRGRTPRGCLLEL